MTGTEAQMHAGRVRSKRAQAHKHEIEYGDEQQTWLVIKYDDRHPRLITVRSGSTTDELHDARARIYLRHVFEKYYIKRGDWCNSPRPGQAPHLALDGGPFSFENSLAAISALMKHVEMPDDYDPDEDDGY